MKTVRLDSFNNNGFSGGAGFIKRTCWFLVNVLFFISPFNPLSFTKIFFLRFFGAKIGFGVTIKPSVNIKYPWRLKVGNNVWIGEGVWIDNLAFVEICDNVCVSQGAMLLTGNHDYKKTTFDLLLGPILLEEGVWIGAKAVVCPGVVCRSHSILSVGSIATKKMEPFTIYQGNPAVPVRERKIEV
jgi:putative colanic acid biosynthesis acetyltransferase WcaF